MKYLLQTVIKAVVRQLCGISVDSMPCMFTVAMMTYEIGVLLVGEVMYTQDNITLFWRPSSVDGQHIILICYYCKNT